MTYKMNMTTLKSQSGRKGVNIRKNDDRFVAMYVQYDNANNREQVLQSKSFATKVRAEKWANQILN